MKKLKKDSKFKEDELVNRYERICELNKIINFEKHRKEVRKIKKGEYVYE